MSVLNLTRPIRIDAAAGSVLPWESPYRTEPIATLDHNGANLFFIEMSPAAATRIVGRRIFDPAAPSVRDVDPAVIINRSATVVRLPAEPGSEIGADAVEDAFTEAPVRPGDAVLLVTGWGDRPAEISTREDYVLRAPYLADVAVAALRGALAATETDLVLTDLPYLTRPGGLHAREEWVALAPWLRPAWPSPNAQAYLRHYVPEKVRADWDGLLRLLEDAWLVLGLVNGAALDATHTTLTVAPFQVRDAGEAPCTVVTSVR